MNDEKGIRRGFAPQFGAKLLLWLGMSVLGLRLLAQPAHGAYTSGTNRPPPLAVAALPFNNPSGDASLSHWGNAFADLLNAQLSLVRGVERIPWKEVRSALTNAGWSPRRPIGPEMAEHAIRELKADAVFWGEFSRSAGGWRLQIQTTRKGQVTPPASIDLPTASMNELLNGLAPMLANSLGAQLEITQFEKLRKLKTTSDVAWDQYAQVLSLEWEDAPPATRERILRRILVDEPQFVSARMGLVEILSAGERMAEAQSEARELINQAPELCGPHLMLAWLLARTGKGQEAETELNAALHRHPGCPSACGIVFLLLHDTDRLKDLRGILEQANQDLPEQPSTLAFLASTRARCGDADGAEEILLNLPPAERENYHVHAALLEAAAHCRYFFLASREIRWLRARVSADSEIRDLVSMVDASFSIQARQTPAHPVRRPRAYTSETLETELERRLTPEERRLVVNPVEITPEIAAQAEKLTAGLTNQLLQALVIFGEVAERGRGSGSGGSRTAPQALAGADDPRTRFSCQEFAKLFVALARAAGLDACLVHVDVDANGRAGWHDCAALFLSNHAFLVDPTARAFIISHEEFRVLDDLQAIAHQAMQSSHSDALPRLRLGAKLDPDNAWTRLKLVEGLVKADLLAEAEAELASLQGNCTSRWDFYYITGCLLTARQRFQPALAAMQQALSLSPSNPVPHLATAKVYWHLEDYGKAREHTETATRLDVGDNFDLHSEQRQFELKLFGALELTASGQPGSRQALERRAEAGDVAAQFALAKLFIEATPPDVTNALRWLLAGAKQGDPQIQQLYAHNLLVAHGSTAGPEAVQWLTLSAKQGNAVAQLRLGLILYEGKIAPRDPVTACQWVLLAADSGDKEARNLLREMTIFLDQSQLAEARKRAAEFKPKIGGGSKTGSASQDGKVTK
jgi:tetratricopeptide (TPR) repeat protein